MRPGRAQGPASPPAYPFCTSVGSTITSVSSWIPGAASQRMLPCIFASIPPVARCRSSLSCVFLARMSSCRERATSLISVSREACMPKSICPRNSIFQRLSLNWGENIPRYFLSCSRVLNAIMLSFPMSVSLGWFLARGIIPHQTSGTDFPLISLPKTLLAQ